jgi:dihydrofolate reductase
MIVSFLAAMDRNLVIGDEKGIPWHLPADLKRFRKLTLGKPIVMGRTTFEHIGRALDKRPNIVMTRRTDYRPEGVTVVHSVDEAIFAAGDAPELVVIGGGAVFQCFLPVVMRLYLTFVEGEFRGTAHFPEWIPAPANSTWREMKRERFPADDKNPYQHVYVVLERVQSSETTAGAIHVRSLARGQTHQRDACP